MGKYKIFSGLEVCSILEKYGFAKIRQKGSHIIMQKSIKDSTITVPVPNHKELAIGTLSSIIRQSGVPKKAFEP